MSTAAPPILSRALIDDDVVALTADGAGWFAVLDACDEPAVLEHLEIQRGETVGGDPPPFKLQCLFRGEAAEQSWEIAPYLTALTPPVFTWIRASLKDRPWGWLCRTQVKQDVLYKHLRKQLYVDGPDGGKMYFRYYDPRVLPPVLETCSAKDLATFFGPIQTLVLPETEGRWTSLSLRSSLSATTEFRMPDE